MMNTVGFYCNVMADGTVIPFPGYEGTYTDLRGFKGPCLFDVIDARDGQPAQVHVRRSPTALAPSEAAVVYNPVINFAFFDWSYWNDATNAWIDQNHSTVFGVDGPAAMPNNSYHIDASGSVDPFATTIRTLAFTMLDPANNNGWKIRTLYFFRWKGEPNNPAAYPYGIRNIKVGGTATVRFEIWKRTYTDVAFPGATFVDSFHEYKDYPIDASGGTIGNGIPSAITFSGFTSPQIDTFAQLTITDTWPQVIYGSGNLNVHYWIKAASFTVA